MAAAATSSVERPLERSQRIEEGEVVLPSIFGGLNRKQMERERSSCGEKEGYEKKKKEKRTSQE